MKKNSSKECKNDIFSNIKLSIQNKTKDKSGILKKRSASLKIEYIIFPHVLSVIILFRNTLAITKIHHISVHVIRD